MIMQLLYDLIQIIEESPTIPLTGKKIIDDEVFDILDKIKANLPSEILQAQQIIEKKDQIIAEAKFEGEKIIKDKENYATRRVCESDIIQQANEMAEKLLNDARLECEDKMQGANEYADSVLESLEEALNQNLMTIKRGRQKLSGFKSLDK